MAFSNNDLTLKVGFDIDRFSRELQKTNQQLDSWSSGITSGLTKLSAAFIAVEVSKFALNVSKLAGEAQGVKEAFDRLPASIQLMQDLKTATHGTVSELDLMKRSVMASNFDISLKALPKLLEFATLRAKQTGQSIDYLVDSIVTGIGRKSKLILDNLGISAVQLTEALGGASAASSTIGQVADAVGRIAESNLKTMGSLSENASTKIERLGASWVNLKIAIGDNANSTGILGGVIDTVTASMDLLTSKSLSFWEKLAAMAGGSGAFATAQLKDWVAQQQKLVEEQRIATQVIKEADRAIATFGDDIDAIKKAYAQNIYFAKIMAEITRREVEILKQKDAQIENEHNLTELLNEKKAESLKLTGLSRALINLEIQAIEKKITALQKLGVEQDKVNVKTFSVGGAITKPGTSYADALYAMGKKQHNKTDENADDTDWHKWKLMQEQIDRTAQSAARAGDIIGQALGNMVTGAQTFGQAMAQVAISVVSALERMALAFMIEKSAQFGPVGIALAAAGFGVVKSLFGKIGNAGGSSGIQRSSSFGGGYGGMNIRVSGEFQLHGTTVKALIKNQDRFDGRTKSAS